MQQKRAGFMTLIIGLVQIFSGLVLLAVGVGLIYVLATVLIPNWNTPPEDRAKVLIKSVDDMAKAAKKTADDLKDYQQKRKSP
jgi:hypothetical protein